MDCLANFIGIRQACVGSPLVPSRSGFYIESFPGITKAALQAIEPGVYLNAKAFLDQLVQDAWINIVGLDVGQALEPYIRAKDALEFGTLGEYDEEATYLAGEAVPRGYRLEKHAGMMGKLQVARVWVKAEDAGTFTITITDGKTPLTLTVEAEAGTKIPVWAHYTTERDRVDITITDAAFKPAVGDTSDTATFATCTNCPGSSMFQTLRGFGLKSGTTGDALQGIIVEGGLQCDIGLAVCMLAPQLKVPIFYATVMKVLENWEATARMNFFAQHKAKWVEATYKNLADKVYPTAWELHSKGLAVFASQLDGQCVDCGTGTHGGYGTP